VLPYENCRHVTVAGACPVCTGKRVIIAHDVHETVIFDEKDRARALAHLAERGAAVDLLGVDPTRTTRTTPEGGPLVEELAPSGPEWKIKGMDAQVGEYQAEARAVCLRCRSTVGRLVTKFNTLFGRSEDQRVLSGRYGIVIGVSER